MRRDPRGFRIVARLDIKGPNLIKGIHLEGLRVIGDPEAHATRYYEGGADEILYVDIVASLYGRNNLVDVVRRTADHVFVPLTVAGGIRSVDDARTLLRAGADKVAVNTAAVKDPTLIQRLVEIWGSSTVVLSVEAKRVAGRADAWEAYTDCGRERTGLDVMEWVERAAALGVGEILLTSVDAEGTRRGYDLDLVERVVARVDVPVVASGGLGEPEDLVRVAERGAAAGAVADALHHGRHDVAALRAHCISRGLDVRTTAPAGG